MTKAQRITEIEEQIGSLSSPSKMPCYSYSISARDCITGGKLVKLENSICHGCYALKGNYNFSNVKNSAFAFSSLLSLIVSLLIIILNFV